jgi:succinoglycan biosynthesis transport protein ExoP
VRAREVVASIERSSDLVLIDSPPVLPVSDALIVSGMVDATLLVASAKSSSRRALHRSFEVLRQVDAPLVGTVLNNAASAEHYAAYGYGYSSGADGKRASRRERRKASRAGR